MSSPLLTAEEIGSLIHVSGFTVLAWARQGKIPAKRYSRKVVRFDLEEVLGALNGKQG